MFHAMVKTQFSSTIKTLRSDGGGEYTSKSFESFLTSNGINHQISCPYTPQQNGLVERKHRHVIETTITLLSQASLPSSYLSFAVQSTMTLINLLPIATLGFSSPWYKLHGQHPDISSLKIFGCACYSFLKPYTKHKLNHRTTKCLFFGYSKGYLCLDLLTHTLYTYKHVLFNEAKFPFSSTPSSASISHTPNPNVWLSNLLYLHSSNQPSILGPYSTSTSHSTNPSPNLTSHTSCHFPLSYTSQTFQPYLSLFLLLHLHLSISLTPHLHLLQFHLYLLLPLLLSLHLPFLLSLHLPFLQPLP